MGTPHAGSSLKKFATALSTIINLGPKKPNQKILDVLDRHSEVLSLIQADFQAMMKTRERNNEREIKLLCCIEELPVTGLGRVSNPLPNTAGHTHIVENRESLRPNLRKYPFGTTSLRYTRII